MKKWLGTHIPALSPISSASFDVCAEFGGLEAATRLRLADLLRIDHRTKLALDAQTIMRILSNWQPFASPVRT